MSWFTCKCWGSSKTETSIFYLDFVVRCENFTSYFFLLFENCIRVHPRIQHFIRHSPFSTEFFVIPWCLFRELANLVLAQTLAANQRIVRIPSVFHTWAFFQDSAFTFTYKKYCDTLEHEQPTRQRSYHQKRTRLCLWNFEVEGGCRFERFDVRDHCET